MKDEGFNLNIMIFTLKAIRSYDIRFERKLSRHFFGHAFSKACEYDATNKKFVKI